jgi:hypothetical protein
VTAHTTNPSLWYASPPDSGYSVDNSDITAVGPPTQPHRFGLYQNIPNPFNPTTVIPFDVPEGGGRIKINIYDVHGRLVRTLIDSHLSAGRKTVMWDAKNSRGIPVASGVYFYRLEAPNYKKSLKMTLVE